MTIQPGASLYTQGFGSRPEDIEIPHIDIRAPTTTDVNYPIGKRWIDIVNNAEYTLTSLSSLGGTVSANWEVSAGGNFIVSSLSGDTGTATPTAGDIKLAGTTSEITTAASGSTVTFSLPAAIIAPGSLTTTTFLNATTTVTAGTGITSTTGNIVATAGQVNAGTSMTAATDITATTGNIVATAGQVNAGTSMTAGTTITATLGDITATNGNFVGSTAGTGFMFNANANSGDASGPVVLDSRAGQVTFTNVSIVAAADLTLTITNAEITGATTQVIYSMSGSTTGSAPSIKSITNSAGSSAIVVTNGTGATTTTADITFNFLVVN